VVNFGGDIRAEQGSLGGRKNPDVSLGIVAAAGHSESGVLVAPLGDDIYSARCGEIAKMGEIRTLIDFHSIDSFWNEPMEIRVSLAVRVADHIHRYTVDGNLKVSSMIRIEAAKENLIGFAAAMMLTDDQPRHQAHNIARCIRWTKFQIFIRTRLLGRGRRRLLAPDVDFDWFR
jgi:hypothetical protein